MTYKAFLVETVTGVLGAELMLVADPSWSQEYNGIPTGSVTVSTQQIRQIPRLRWQPYFGSILLTFTTFYGVEEPVEAGPIIAYPDVSPSMVKIEFKSIRHIFEKRHVLRDGPIKGQPVIEFTRDSYGVIAQEVVKIGMDRPNGGLPITFPSPREATGRIRTYEPWNIANLSVHDVLTKLTEVRNGPAIMFRPEWANDAHTAIVWAMHHGTHDNPHIYQTRVPDFDLTAEAIQITDLAVRSTGAKLTHRVYATGAGEGEGTVSTYRENLRYVRQGYPFLEESISDSEVEDDNGDRLQGYADDAVQAGQEPIDQISLTIPVDTEKNPFGSWHVGDEVMVTTPDLVVIPEGTYPMRIIAASGGGATITIELQEVSL